MLLALPLLTVICERVRARGPGPAPRFCAEGANSLAGALVFLALARVGGGGGPALAFAGFAFALAFAPAFDSGVGDA